MPASDTAETVSDAAGGRSHENQFAGDGLDVDRVADRGVGELAGVGVETEREAVVLAAGLGLALVGQRHRIRHGRVGQRVGRAVRHCTRHVRHVVED